MASLAAIIFWAATDGPAVLHAQDKGAKKKGQPLTHPVPAAGTTVNVSSLAKIIDDEIALRLKQEKIPASAKCDDSEFIRRVYLDIVGVIPSVDRVKAFLDNKDPNKREQLIDQLLANGNFGKQLSEIWMHEIISLTDPENRLLPLEGLRKWMETGFNNGKPWSKMVEEMLTSSGTVEDNPTTIFFAANKGVDKVTGQVTRLFLGVQLQCAQCHNHPFTDWKQDEYWGMAAFFKGVKQNVTPKKAAKDGTPVTITEVAVAGGPAAGKVLPKKKKGADIPEGFKNVPPKFLAGSTAKVTGAARPVLAKWLTSTDNPYFARAMVNRMWAHFFGRGFVNPIDDMHDNNPATHPELLIALAEQFKRHNYDLKYLVKSIVMSDTYQRSSKPSQGNDSDTEFFSRMYIRSMTAEQMYDSFTVLVGAPGKGGDKGAKKGGMVPGGKKGGGGPREQFVRFFRLEEGADPLEYQDGIPQALRLMNGPIFNKGGNTLEAALKQKSAAEGIKYLHLAVFARPPTTQETQRLSAYMAKQANTRIAYNDILWAMLNSSEFRLNH
ncbi:MAG TPA: DUF1553 domain-containing protein [Gemmataceae bacterium]|nr:DUF1553 domain-containing protein [Gemmataceae bacterium]